VGRARLPRHGARRFCVLLGVPEPVDEALVKVIPQHRRHGGYLPVNTEVHRL
jgi:hypothetical protein